jgi:WD40 repeat protein
MNKIGRRKFMAMPCAASATQFGSAVMGSAVGMSRKIQTADSVADPVLRETHRLSVDNYVNGITWNARGSRLAALSNFGGTITVWDARTWRTIITFKRYGSAYSQNSFAFLPDGTLLTAAPIGALPDPRSSTLQTFALIQWSATGTALRYIPDRGNQSINPPYCIGPANTFVVSADGSLIAGINGHNVLLFSTFDYSNVTRFEIPPTPSHPDFPVSVAISHDTQLLAVGSGFGYVHLYQVNGAFSPTSFTAFPGGSCQSMTFSPDDKVLATGRGGISVGEIDDGWTRLWQVSDRAELGRLTGGGGFVRAMAWSPDNETFAVGDDRSLRIWRMNKIRPQLEVFRQTPEVTYSVAFSSQGRLASADGNEVKIYQPPKIDI